MSGQLGPPVLTAEDGETTVGLGDVVDELLDEHRLADTGTSKETDLATTGVRSEKVDDLDAGLSGGRLVDEWRRVRVDGKALDTVDGPTLVNGLANDVHDAAEGSLADGDEDGRARVDDLLAPDETLRTVHGNGADGVLAEVGSDLKHEAATVEVLDLKGVENLGKLLRVELDVDDGTNDGLDRAGDALSLSRVGAG
jgi:hypothetical protein